MWDDHLVDWPADYIIFGDWCSAIFEGPNRRLCNKRSREDQGFGVRRFTQRSLRGLDLQSIIVRQHRECAIVHHLFLVQIHLNTLCVRGLFCQTSILISHLAKIDLFKRLVLNIGAHYGRGFSLKIISLSYLGIRHEFMAKRAFPEFLVEC